jgi:hypothetical protein
MKILLSSAYLGPVQYYTKLIANDQICIEKFESYHKQSYRNRCIILAANGPMVLSIPVLGGPGAKAPMYDLQLTYDHNWQHLHWQSIVSAYKNSPFFDYYADDLSPFFNAKKWKYLIDFNSEIQNVILDWIGVSPDIQYTKSYIKTEDVPTDINDFRYSIHPKPQKQQPDPYFIPTPYTQVFQEKFPFYSNLSILDLVMNEGPETLTVLKSSIRKDID